MSGPTLTNAMQIVNELSSIATSRIRFSPSEWPNPSGRYSRVVLPKKTQLIAAHASVRGSGRVGRTAAGRALDEEAVRAAVIAAIRHRHTAYDRMLMQVWSRV